MALLITNTMRERIKKKLGTEGKLMRLCLIPYLHTFFFLFSLFGGGDSLYRRFILTSATKPIKKNWKRCNYNNLTSTGTSY